MPSIVGTWKLAAAVARDRSGNPLPAPYGGKGMGRLTLAADGRMMAVTCDGRPGRSTNQSVSSRQSSGVETVAPGFARTQ